jgi:hypothetical protein
VLRAFLALALMGTLSSCYTFQPVSPGDMTPGDEVRLVIARRATSSITPSVMLGETTIVGDLVDVSEDSLAVSVWIGQAYRGTPFEPVHQTYTFPNVDVVRTDRRKFSSRRTALAAAGILAGIYLMIETVEFLQDPNPRRDSDPDEPPLNPLILMKWTLGRIGG